MTDQSTTTVARAWSITRADGLVLGFTDHDRALSFAGMTFRPDAGLSAQAVVQGAGLSVDNTEALGALSDGAIAEADILAGRWDGAELRQWEVDWTDPAGHRLIFRGHLGEVTRSGGAFKAELRGLSEPLNQPVGRVFHPRCAALLGDGMCKVDLDKPGLSGEARITLTDGARLRLGGLPGFEDRWFERGVLEFLDGAAAGLRGHLKNDRAMPGGAREVDLWVAPGIPAAEGDRVRLVAGCDKSAAMCRLKFGNYLNFRGFPHLPEEDWLMAPGKERAKRPTGFFAQGFGAAMPAPETEILRIARGWLGTPYLHQASVRGAGTDCLGLIRGIWRELYGTEPERAPAYTPDWGEYGGAELLLAGAQRHLLPDKGERIGQVLLFRMRSGAIAKHLGIVSAIGAAPAFIHAYDRHGVTESPLSAPWRQRIAARFRFP